MAAYGMYFVNDFKYMGLDKNSTEEQILNENGDIDYFIVAVLLVDDESRELFWDSFDGNALMVYIITNYDNATSFIENEWGVNPTN